MNIMKAIRIGVCAMVAFTVFAHGVVEPWSESVLLVGAGALLLLWAAGAVLDRDFKLTWTPLLWPLAGLWILAVVQLLAGLTVHAYATRMELAQYSALVTIVFLFVQSFQTREHWRGFVWFLLVLGFAVSLFAILQHFTFNGKMYWVRELRFGGIPFGPYVNRNHFAGLMELLIPSGLAILIVKAERRDQLPLVALFTLLPIGALFLSASRGGIIGCVAEMGLLVLLIAIRRGERRHLAGAALIVILAAGVVWWLGIGRALDRFASYQTLEASESRRASMLHGAWRIFLDHPAVGTGFGTLQDVFPLYETMYDGKIVNHAHNDYVEMLAEMGAVGGLFSAAFIVLLFVGAWKVLGTARPSDMNWAYCAGALTACFGLLVHALVDFNFHIPSNALLFLLQGAMATCLPASFPRVRADS